MKTLSKTALGLLTATLLASTAQAAGTSDKAKLESAEPVPVTVKTIDGNGQTGEITIFTSEADTQKTSVLGAFEQQTTEAYIVRDNDGDLFINHVLDVEELPDPTLELETVDTYTYEYRGIVFTNKITEVES